MIIVSCEIYSGIFFSITSFFCGYDQFCDNFNSLQAFDYAVGNIKRSYKFIGILERQNDSLTQLEKRFPVFFRHVFDALYANGSEIRINQGTKKKPVGEQTRQRIAQWLHNDLKLYQLIVDVFFPSK